MASRIVRTPSASPSCSAWSSVAAPRASRKLGGSRGLARPFREVTEDAIRGGLEAFLVAAGERGLQLLPCRRALPGRRVTDGLLELIDRLADGNGPRRGVDLGAGGNTDRGWCWGRHKIAASRYCEDGKTEARDPNLHAEDRRRTADSTCAAYAAGLSRDKSGEITLFRGSGRAQIAARRTGRNAGVDKHRAVAGSAPR